VLSVVAGFLYMSTSRKEKGYGIVFFVCGVKFYVIVYFVYICVNGVQVDFCCVVYD